jgi:uncharacterized membrane protein
MSDKKRTIVNVIFNSVEALVALMGPIWYYIYQLCIERTAKPGTLNLFFTVNSNILLGVCAIIALVFYILHLTKGRKIPYWLSIMKLTSTVMISITFFTVVFFLTPAFFAIAYELYALYNLPMHVIAPLIAIFGFILFETDNKILFKHTPWVLTPLIIYMCVYTSLVLGTGNLDYDLYGFAHTYEGDSLHVGRALISIAIMPLAGYAITAMWWFINRHRKDHLDKETV